MNRALVFPHARDSWILHEDDALLFVDKPVGVPSQTADPDGVEDDLRSRLLRFLEARDGSPAYLGAHQRLDKETSGVLVYTKRRDANASVAAEFEERRAKKIYLACVEGGNLRTGELRHSLREGKDGRMTAAQPRKGSPAAVTVVSTIRPGAGKLRTRARVTLDLRTGRTHQARAQLAAVGAPIAGDRLYEGAPAPRLLLHARSLTIQHPRSSRSPSSSSSSRLITVEAPEPEPFGRFMGGDADAMLVYDDAARIAGRLRLAIDRRYALAWSDKTDAFRLVNEGGDDLPGLAVDVYGDFAVAQFYEGDDRGWTKARRENVLDALASAGFDGVYEKHRPKHASTLVDTRREDVAPRHASRGVDAPEVLIAREEGMNVEARLGDGLSTGIFLDQRRARAAVRAEAKDRRVLNLFAYTCGFSVAAALGGARSTVSVDVSQLALDRGRANLAKNGINADPHHVFLTEDVLAWIERAKKLEPFDLAIVDPPSFATTKKNRFSIEQDLGSLVVGVLGLLRDGGVAYVSTNHRGLSRAKFRHVLLGAVRSTGRELAQLKDGPEPVDYPPAPGREPHLKSAWIRLGKRGSRTRTDASH